jgi:ABC-type transport system involved in multi-copper enzyme maturation permease subunit
MLTSIARFEIRYQLKSPIFWITSVVFFSFAFSLTYSDEIQFGWGGYVVRNSPYTIALTCMVLTLFAVFIATTFAASVVLRDDETGFGPIVRATPVTKSAYLFGRFAGGFAVCCLVYLSVPLGALVGAAMPGLDPETVGPFRAAPSQCLPRPSRRCRIDRTASSLDHPPVESPGSDKQSESAFAARRSLH